MVSSIRLQNFRSYGDGSFEFEPGVNIVVGPNASGKTNLLEAVLVLCRGNSYRGKDSELIKFGRGWARLDGYFNSSVRTLKIEQKDDNLEKTYLFDDKTFKRMGLDKTVPVVYFEPNHLQLFARGPDQRRDYFDDLLERTDPGFRTINLAYKRTLAQRNALLKRGPHYGKKQLFAWNLRLAELGEKIVAGRAGLVNDINQGIQEFYSQIAGRKSAVALEYASQFQVEHYSSRLLSRLEASVDKDFERGFTGHGPHREDFIAILNGQPASVTASRGEARSLMLALKVFELGLIEKARASQPIFLLDDVFSELDGSRRKSLVAFLKDRQTIITTTDADTAVEYFSNDSRLISLR